jgi:hypothetical protein
MVGIPRINTTRIRKQMIILVVWVGKQGIIIDIAPPAD